MVNYYIRISAGGRCDAVNNKMQKWVDLDIIDKLSFCNFIPWDRLCNSNLLITGATGLIGSSLIRVLEYYNQEHNLNCRLFALVRDANKARCLFGERVELIIGNVEERLKFDEKLDYIIHCACPTASDYMISNPVEVIKASVVGTINLLDVAKIMGASFLYLSSMEVYGEIKTEKTLAEDDLGYINPLTIRSCYPESKRLCEAIVSSYAEEYGVDAKSVRLAQTFGPGIKFSDKRVFAMIARSVINGTDIIFKTKGESKHPYLYISDAISAMLTVLLKGDAGKSYNASNPETYCSIYEMGIFVANEFGQGLCKVKTEDGDASMYPNTTYLNLDISSISKLGWFPLVNLSEMYFRLIEYMKAIR